MRSTTDQQSTRRHFLSANAMGLGSVALSCLLQEEQLLAKPRKPDLVPQAFNLVPKQPHHEPKARAVISLWMQGGPSHIDLFDPKPKLNELDGKTFPGKIKYDNAAQASSRVLGCPWKFAKHGESGMDVSELLPNIAGITDDITLIRSMKTGVNNHGQSIRALTNGTILGGQPALGSWVTYGLGAETQDLPAYMALIDPGQLPVLGVENWNNGYLPALYQGTVVRPREPRILNLTAPRRLHGKPQQLYLDFLEKLNQQDLSGRPGELDLQARISTYQLAARMQTAARDALDLSQETEATKKLYGMDEDATREYGSRCLIARRLVERGVRFVQVFTQNQFWDHHGSINTSLPNKCRQVDKPVTALLRDLKQHGLLDETLVIWGSEFGRTPMLQSDRAKAGRDHHKDAFCAWLAGGGIKGGVTVGETDDLGYFPAKDPVSVHDLHATVLHLLGIDHQRLTYRFQGRPYRLTDVAGNVVTPLLA